MAHLSASIPTDTVEPSNAEYRYAQIFGIENNDQISVRIRSPSSNRNATPTRASYNITVATDNSPPAEPRHLKAAQAAADELSTGGGRMESIGSKTRPAGRGLDLDARARPLSYWPLSVLLV
jgi:hypothetical protein